MGSITAVTFVDVFFFYLESNQTDAIIVDGALGDVDLEAVLSPEERSASVSLSPHAHQQRPQPGGKYAMEESCINHLNFRKWQ